MPLNLVEEIAARAKAHEDAVKAAQAVQTAQKDKNAAPPDGEKKAAATQKPKTTKTAASPKEKVTLPKNRYTIYLTDGARMKLDMERAKTRKSLSTIIEEALSAFLP